MSHGHEPAREVPDGRGSKIVTETARKVVLVRFGRGRGGGSTYLDVMIQQALVAGRRLIIADGDRRNPTLAGLYPASSPYPATQPASDDPAVVKDWITDVLGDAIETESSVVLDMGGGDTAIQDLVRDVEIVEFAEMNGYHPVGAFFCGADMDDFDHILSIWRSGYFRPKRSILVFNDFLVQAGRPVETAFQHIQARPEMAEMTSQGMEIMNLPRLPCMEDVRRKGLSFLEATTRKPGLDGLPLNPLRQHMVKQWLDRINANLASIGATEWMP